MNDIFEYCDWLEKRAALEWLPVIWEICFGLTILFFEPTIVKPAKLDETAAPEVGGCQSDPCRSANVGTGQFLQGA